MKNRIDLPSSRQPPEDILRRLREIDPATDLHWIEGPGVVRPYWVLGVVKDRSTTTDGNASRRAIGLKLLAACRAKPSVPQWGKEAMGRLLMADFAYIINWDEHKDGTLGALVENFREADHNYRTDPEGTFARKLDEAEDGPAFRERQAIMHDKAQSDARAIYRHVFRKQVHVQVPRGAPASH